MKFNEVSEPVSNADVTLKINVPDFTTRLDNTVGMMT